MQKSSIAWSLLPLKIFRKLMKILLKRSFLKSLKTRLLWKKSCKKTWKAMLFLVTLSFLKSYIKNNYHFCQYIDQKTLLKIPKNATLILFWNSKKKFACLIVNRSILKWVHLKFLKTSTFVFFLSIGPYKKNEHFAQ